MKLEDITKNVILTEAQIILLKIEKTNISIMGHELFKKDRNRYLVEKLKDGNYKVFLAYQIPEMK